LRAFHQYIILGFLAISAIASELISYYSSSLFSRIALLVGFSGLLLLIVTAYRNFAEQKSFGGKTIIFAASLIISLLFLFRRYYLMSPAFMEAVVNSEKFVTAQSYNVNHFILFNTPHSFLFQNPLILNLLGNIGGFSTEQVAYISLLLQSIIVAMTVTFLLEIFERMLRNAKGITKYLLPPLVAFSMLSFEYSERTEIALPMMFLLMTYLFHGGFADRRKAVAILVLVLGITFGSATSILVMIPFFFLYSVFERRASSMVYGLVPLAYLMNAGYLYTLSLGYYSLFSIQGLRDFLIRLIGGQLPERVLPWQRSTATIVEDVYLTSAAYLSLLLLCALVLVVYLLIRVVTRHQKSDRGNALFLATIVTLLFAFGIAAIAYVGASVQPETTSSDIRTIAVVFTTIFLPFTLVSNRLFKTISSNRILLILVIVLLIFASLRTFYEPYPKSFNDPIVTTEDWRVDSFSTHRVGDFLKRFVTGGSIAFDYKTGPAASRLLSDDSFQTYTFTSTVTFSSYVVFDINGLKYGSLHTTPEAYIEAVNLTLSQNVIYDSRNLIIIKRR